MLGGMLFGFYAVYNCYTYCLSGVVLTCPLLMSPKASFWVLHLQRKILICLKGVSEIQLSFILFLVFFSPYVKNILPILISEEKDEFHDCLNTHEETGPGSLLILLITQLIIFNYIIKT